MHARWLQRLMPLSIHDPLKQRQTPLLLLVLVCMFTLSLLRTLFFFAADQAAIGTMPTLVVDTISLSAPAFAIVLLRRGHFTAAALLAALSMLVAIIIAAVASGLRQSGMLPLVFALPIVFTGLLLDWRWLSLVAGSSCAAVLGIAVLESQGSPAVSFAPAPEFPASMAATFTVITILLVVLLSRFRVNYRQELADRVRVEATLRQSEARFATAFRSSPAALVIVRLHDGVFLDANASFVRLFGYTRDELLGQRGDALGVFPESTQGMAILTSLREGGSLHDLDVQLRTKGGMLRELLISLEALELDGEPCVLGMALDITERKRAAHDLQRTAADLQALVNDYAQVLVREQQARRVAEALHTAGQLLARPLTLDAILETLLDVMRQLIPYDSATIMLPDGPTTFRVRYLRGYETSADVEAVKARIFDLTQRTSLAQIVATQRSHLIADTHQEPTWEPGPETRAIRCWIGVPLIANNTLVGIFSIDRHEAHSLTAGDVQLAETLAVSAATAIERAQLLAQLRDERAQLARRVTERTADLSLANAELTRATRLKDEFLASMSHELRTPLNSILGRSEALQEAIYGPVTDKQIAALQGIEESGQHLLALINDILDLSKIEAGRLDLDAEPFQVDLLCPLCLRMVAQTALTKRISLSSAYDSQIQTLIGDERRLKQILVNLLSNAVKFTPEGGKVGLDVRGDPEEQTVTFTVWDTGIGIDAEDLPKLFQPFVQLDSSLSRQYTGTGLGLSLVSRLAKAHGGSVCVDSTPGVGSRFQVTIPWKPATPADRAAPQTTVLPTTRPVIGQAMVIDDSPTAAEQLSRYLHELGAQVEVLPQGTGVIARAIALQPDVILLDILLPDDDGWQVLRQLKAEPRVQAIPVVIVSVIDLPEQARALGAAASLIKPIDRVTLENTLRRVLSRQKDTVVQLAIIATPTARQPKLLLAEDNEANITTISDYLGAKGYEVVIARNGIEAVVRAQEERPDVILMDIQMPGMDGLETIRRLRAAGELARIPIIAMTALAMPGDHERCLSAGADDYMAKPVQLRKLVAAIEALRSERDRERD